MKSCKSEAEEKKLIYWRCATDIELFSKFFFAHYCEYSFNTFHRDSFKGFKFEERKIRRVDAAPRGYAKSTIKAFIKPIHDVCYKLETFIVIASNTDSQSISKLKDIQAEFLANSFLIDVYGNFLESKRIGSTDFVANNNGHKVRFLAVGSKTEIRGIRFGASRPSKVILDDYEHSTEVENEEIRDKYEANFKDVFSKIGNKNTNIEVIGTVLHRKALLVKILKNPRYSGKTYKAIISWAENKELWNKWKAIYTDIDAYEEDSERIEAANQFYHANKEEMDKGVDVLWPDHESYYELQEEIIETGYRSFMKEKQNSPMSDEEKIFDPERMKFYTEVDEGFKMDSGVVIPWKDLQLCYGVIDPATGQTKAKKGKKGDFTCILAGYEDRKGRVFVHYDYTKRIAPSIYVGKTFDFHDQFDFYKFGVETNLYKNLLIPNMIDERKRREKEKKKILKLPFYEIDQVENKQKRIYTIEPKVEHGWMVFNKALSQEFYDQLFEFPKGDHDDCPDALEMLWSLVHNRYKSGGVKKGVGR